jgi:hypothetical protein
MPPLNVMRFVGESSVPRNVRRQRENNLETLRRFGTPIVVKHMYNDQDVQAGIAEQSKNFSSVYGQTRNADPLSHGVGFVSVEKATDEWISPAGKLVLSPVFPGTGHIPAPKYRGYGPGFLTYAILPDASEDEFKVTEGGALIRTQIASAQMGWYPDVSDNDLLVIVELDNGENIISTRDRFLLKQTSPASFRGLDRKGRREYGEDFGNRHVSDQSFQMTLIPHTSVLYTVEVDR